jgi:hypothetical protein
VEFSNNAVTAKTTSLAQSWKKYKWSKNLALLGHLGTTFRNFAIQYINKVSLGMFYTSNFGRVE